MTEFEIFCIKLHKACPVFWPKDFGHVLEIEEGWYELVLETSVQIERTIESLLFLYPKEALPKPAQIKEKFGKIRFYWHSEADLPQEIYDKIYDIILNAENKSINICEFCGSREAHIRNINEGKKWAYYKCACDTCVVSKNK
jgi:hypothetical protein